MKAVYPGTFDPITLGHMDVVERASKLFEEVIVGIATHPGKKPLFSIGERKRMAEKAVAHLDNVKVETLDGLLVAFARARGAKVIIRGLREVMDFAEEFQRTTANRMLDMNIETVFIMTSEKYFFLNSTLVKEIAAFRGDLGAFVPPYVESALREKLDQ